MAAEVGPGVRSGFSTIAAAVFDLTTLNREAVDSTATCGVVDPSSAGRRGAEHEKSAMEARGGGQKPKAAGTKKVGPKRVGGAMRDQIGHKGRRVKVTK